MKIGKYQHFRNKKFYEVIGVAKHSETEEELVVYKDSIDQLWVRPKVMFLETVEHEGMQIPRFAFVG